MLLWERLLSRSILDELTGCLEWSGARNNYGYGRIMINRKVLLVHRLSYEINTGEIPRSDDVCHKCDNRRCIEPSHLFAGSRKMNMQDCTSKGRQSRGSHRPMSKLTPKDIVSIRQDTRSQKDIAADFGVKQQQISRIKTGKQWACF